MRHLQRLLFVMAAFLTLTGSLGCAATQPAPEPSPSPTAAVNPYEAFREALEAVGDGDLGTLLALRSEPTNPETIQFLQTLYGRYGTVSRIYSLSYNQEGDIQRGVFLAAHRGGPFLWDFVKDGDQYTLLRGTPDLEPLLKPAPAPDDVIAVGNHFVDQVNAGDVDAVFSAIVCNCVSLPNMQQQIAALLERGGEEKSRHFVSADAVPGTEDAMLRLHFLSERERGWLSFHALLWKVDDEWKLNGIQWASDELIPRVSYRP